MNFQDQVEIANMRHRLNFPHLYHEDEFAEEAHLDRIDRARDMEGAR